MFVRAVVKEGVNAQAILVPSKRYLAIPGQSCGPDRERRRKVEQRMLSLDRL